MKTYEEYETGLYLYRKIGRAAYGAEPGEVHHVRQNKKARRRGYWADVSAGRYETQKRLATAAGVRSINPMPGSVAVDVVVLEHFTGPAREYRKARIGFGSNPLIIVQSRGRGKGPMKWVNITPGRYEHMQLKWAPKLTACPPDPKAFIATLERMYGGPTGTNGPKTPQGARIKAEVAELEERAQTSNDMAKVNREGFLEVSAQLGKVEAERDGFLADAQMNATQRDKLRDQVKACQDGNGRQYRIIKDLQTELKASQEHDHRLIIEGEERLGEVARECADLKTRLQAAEHGWNHAEEGLRNANQEEARLKGLVDVANARWEAFVDKVVSPPMSTQAADLQNRNAELRSLIDGQAKEIGRLQRSNKTLQQWKNRAEALRRILKSTRGGRIITWASVDTYASKMEK